MWLYDARLIAQLASKGIPFDHHKMDELWRSGVDVVGAAAGCDEWTLLWQLDECAMGWGNGKLYVLIRRDDLAAKRFDRVWSGHQST